MAKDPRLPNALLNAPDNWLTEINNLKLRMDELDAASTPPIEEIIGGRLTLAELILSPAEGVLIADPTSTDYTGSFIAGDGILFSGTYYVMGNVVNGVLKTGFTDAGTLFATDAEIEGTIIIGAGSAGGWLINATQIYSLGSDIGIILDSSVPSIQVGDTAGTHIVIDGANEWIRSSNFVAGASGFNIAADTGDAEFNNIVARGELRTFLLTSSNQMAVAGNILVSKDAGKLGADVASSDTTVNFGKALIVGDWIKIQGSDSAGSNSLEWMLIGSLVSGTTYNVTRNVDGTGANNWLKDTPFVVIGANGDSRIELTAGATASLQLITQGLLWNTQTIQASMSTVEGAIMAGGGAVLLDEDGILLQEAGDAITFYDANSMAYGAFSQIDAFDNAAKVLRMLAYEVSTETNRVANGDFETGSLSSWTEVDSGSQISISALGEGYGGGYAVVFAPTAASTDYIQQTITSSPFGIVVKFRVKIDGYANIYVTGASATHKSIGTNNEWRTYYIVVYGSTTDFRIAADPLGGTPPSVYIDDIVVLPLDGAGVTPSASSLEMAGNDVRFATTNFEVRDTANNSILWMYLDSATKLIRINNDGLDFDTNIRGLADDNLIYVDAGNDRIGIGTAAPAYKLDVNGNVNVASGSNFLINGVPVGGGDWVLIAEIETTSGGGISFTSIAGTYKALRLVGMLRSNRANIADRAGLQFNGDTGANYYATANTIIITGGLNTVETLAGTSIDAFNVNGDSAPASAFASIEITIPYYAKTTFHKNAQGYSWRHQNTTTNNQTFANGGGIWKSTSAITRIDIIPTNGGTAWMASSIVALYGLK